MLYYMIINTQKGLNLAETIIGKTQYFLTYRCLDFVQILWGYT